MPDNLNDVFPSLSGKVLSPAGNKGNVIDEVTVSFKGITTDHSNIHAGIAYNVFNKFTLAAAASGFFEIIVPAGAYVHFKPVAMQSDGPKITVQLIEAPSLVTGSTSVTPVNRRRIGTPAPSILTVKNNPTSVSGGTIIDQDYLGGGTGAGASSASGNSASSENEWVLKPATTYVVKVTNGGTGSTDVNIKLFWYEESAG